MEICQNLAARFCQMCLTPMCPALTITLTASSVPALWLTMKHPVICWCVKGDLSAGLVSHVRMDSQQKLKSQMPLRCVVFFLSLGAGMLCILMRCSHVTRGHYCSLILIITAAVLRWNLSCLPLKSNELCCLVCFLEASMLRLHPFSLFLLLGLFWCTLSWSLLLNLLDNQIQSNSNSLEEILTIRLQKQTGISEFWGQVLL